ncbi:TPA: transcriptional regulator [Vibrio alginolyticus]
MGYGATVYSLDIEKVFNVLKNERNPELEKAIMERCQDSFKVINEMLESSGESIRAEELLMQMLSEEIKYSHLGYAYAYLLEAICKITGYYLSNNSWYPCDVNDFCDIPFTNTDYPIKFPFPDDFPVVFMIKNQDIHQDNVDFGGLSEQQISEVKSWYTHAVVNNRDLVLFYY